MKIAKLGHKNDIAVPLPVGERRPIPHGCDCPFCKSHRHLVPMWDAVGIEPETQIQWVIHYPELSDGEV